MIYIRLIYTADESYPDQDDVERVIGPFTSVFLDQGKLVADNEVVATIEGSSSAWWLLAPDLRDSIHTMFNQVAFEVAPLDQRLGVVAEPTFAGVH